MTIRGAWVAVPALALALAACARPAADDGRAGSPYRPDDLVLQVSETGGLLTPELTAARLPVVSVYGDGRVITQGPTIAVHPGPALPDLQVQRIGQDAVQDLVDRALDAGVGDTTDLGRPPVADVPSTRFTVSTGLETLQREVHALAVVDERTGLTDEQVAARARLRAFADELTGLSSDAAESYRPTSVAALVTPYPPPGAPEPGQPEVPWPGPALPGGPFEPDHQITCVVTAGEDATAVLDAARSATTLTPWVGADGTRWSVTFRPLLPSETGCADLRSG